MFIIVCIIISLSLLFNYFKIRKYTKHDKYLYQFCSLRRDVMAYLRGNHDIISRQDYLDSKQVLRALNIAIDLYSKDKANVLFNLRKLSKLVKSTKSLSSSSFQYRKSDNQTINNFRNELDLNIIKTFYAYTPFMFAEIYLNFLYYSSRLLIKIGARKLNKWSDKIRDLNEDFDNINSRKKQLCAN